MADQLPLNGAFWFDGLDQLGEVPIPLNLDFLLVDEDVKPLPADAAHAQQAPGAAPKRKGGRRPLSAEEKAARAEKEKEQNRVMQVGRLCISDPSGGSATCPDVSLCQFVNWFVSLVCRHDTGRGRR